MPRDYSASLDLLRRAERSIPLGSQTFSKSRTALPRGAAPLFPGMSTQHQLQLYAQVLGPRARRRLAARRRR